SNLTSNIIEVEDSLEAANDWFCRKKLSDGLPIVPPTAERVERMLDGTKRDPQEVIGSIPPKWAPATVEKIAINAVMVVCRNICRLSSLPSRRCASRASISMECRRPLDTLVLRSWLMVPFGSNSTSTAMPGCSGPDIGQMQRSDGPF